LSTLTPEVTLSPGVIDMVNELNINTWTSDVMFSSQRQSWETPWPLFNELNKEFQFTLDAAASKENTKCEHYITKEMDSLSQSWNDLSLGGSVWLNPPYGRSIGSWIEKASIESSIGCSVVVLTFCRTDTKWWNRYAMRAAEIRLIPGRIKFVGANSSAPAPSCLLIFDESRRLPRFKTQVLPRRE